jgi:hypothetical protein
MAFGKSYYKEENALEFVRAGIGTSSIQNPKLKNHIKKGV